MIELEAVRIGEFLGPVAALMVGSAQCCLIWLGLRRMERTSRQRDRQMESQSRDAQRRHEEAMTALRTLIERTAVSRPSPRA